MFGGLSMTELIIILGLALLLLGPDQLPSLAKTLGKGLRELRKATDDIKGQFEQEMVNLDEPPKRVLAPVPNPPPTDDAAAPRMTAMVAAEDPAAARAAARRAATTPVEHPPSTPVERDLAAPPAAVELPAAAAQDAAPTPRAVAAA